LASGSILMLAALLLGGRFAAGAFAVTAVLFPVALIALGTRRARPRLRAALVALGATVVLSAIAILLLAPATPGTDPESVPVEHYLFGLPPAAWIALIGLGIAPFVLVVWSHAATFDRGGTGRSDDSGRTHG
jgi:hypothetical protein